MSTHVTLSSGKEPCRLTSHSHPGRNHIDSHHTLIQGGAVSTRVTLSSGEEPYRLTSHSHPGRSRVDSRHTLIREEPCRLASHSHPGRSHVDSRHTLIQGGAVSTHVTLSSREEPCRLVHTCILDSEGSECLVAPQLPLALCGDQPGHTECSCVNFTGGHKHMVHTVISIVSSLAYVVCVYNHAHKPSSW